MARPRQTTPDADAAVLGVVQRAQDRLPELDAPLLDRLFALECAARGGRAVALALQRYRPSLREAEYWLDEHWEPDVRHAAVVGQAMSAAQALDTDFPSNWPDLLSEALAALERRSSSSRFNIGGDPSLLAAVLRGLDAGGMTAPEWLLSAAANVLTERRSAETTAELADALARHRSGQPLVANAVSAVFNTDDWNAADAPYARWWLASRRKEVDRHLSVQVIDDARLQALAAADPLDGKAAAMVLEAAARASGDLIIASAATLSASRSRQERLVGVKLAAYRGAFLCVLCTLGLVFHRRIAHGVATLVSAHGAHAYRQAAVAAFLALLVFTLSESAAAIAKAYGRERPAWVTAITVVGTTVAGVIGAIAG